MSATTATRNEYVQRAKQQLENWNSEIDKIEARGEQLTGDALQKYNNQVYELRQQLNAYQNKLNDLIAGGQENWNALVDELNHISKTFVQSFNYFKSQLKK